MLGLLGWVWDGAKFYIRRMNGEQAASRNIPGGRRIYSLANRRN
jgi:hypothetical protein